MQYCVITVRYYSMRGSTLTPTSTQLTSAADRAPDNVPGVGSWATRTMEAEQSQSSSLPSSHQKIDSHIFCLEHTIYNIRHVTKEPFNPSFSRFNHFLSAPTPRESNCIFITKCPPRASFSSYPDSISLTHKSKILWLFDDLYQGEAHLEDLDRSAAALSHLSHRAVRKIFYSLNQHQFQRTAPSARDSCE